MTAKRAYLGLFMVLAGCSGADLSGEEVSEDNSSAVVALSDGDYTIKAAHSGKCLDVAGAGTQDGAPVQQWDCNGTAAQVFHVASVGNGFVEITNRNSGKALDVSDVSTADGALIQQWTYGGGANQQFEIFDAGNGQQGIRARHSKKALDVKDVSQDNGARIQQWAWSGGANQRWRLEPVGAGGDGSSSSSSSSSGGGSGSGGGTGPADKVVYDYFKSKGFTNFQSAAIVGNLIQESGLDPTISQQNGGPGRGLAQWSAGGRWDTASGDNVIEFARKRGESEYSLSLQLDFIMYELQTFPEYGLAKLKASTSLTDATIDFELDFEGCGIPEQCDGQARINNATNVFNTYGKN